MRWLLVSLLALAACSGANKRGDEPPPPCPYEDRKRCADQPHLPYEKDKPVGRPTLA